MGKSNRIKVAKANQSASSLGNYKKKSGMPNWAVNLIAIAITLAILLSGILLALNANGTVMRMRTAVRSENFRVDGKMMTYFANVQYQNFLTNYSSILSNLSLDTTKPLKDQKFGDTSVNANALDSVYFTVPEGFDGSWQDYFILQAENEVKTMLRYCEEAHKLGLELGPAEEKKIDDAIATIQESATSYGYPLDAFIAASFGEGVKEKDVRHAMELSELATLGMNALSDKLMSEIGNDRITETYNADPSKYNQIDYSFYSFRVDYSEISTDMKAANANVSDAEILEEYRTQINAAKVKAKELLATANNEEFERYLLTELATDEYEAQLETQSLPTEGKPNEEQLAAIKAGIITQAVTEMMSGAKVENAFKQEGEKYVGYATEVSKEYAELFNKIKLEVDDTLTATRDGYVKDKAAYVDSDAFSTWAFDAARQVGETHNILNGDGSENLDESTAVTRESGYFRVDVYRLRATQYKNAEKTHNLAYMVFSTEADAKAAIEDLKAEATVDLTVFERVASDRSASFDVLENYVEGDMGSDDFDAWVFAEGRAVGNYTNAPIKLGDSSYVVLYYTAEGEETWFAKVKDELFNEDYTAYATKMENDVVITVKANVLKKIEIGTN